jgi:hypothetical protein
MKAMSADQDIPESLLNAYYNMLARGIRVRESLDDDY